MAHIKTVPDAASRYARVAKLWMEVRVEETAIEAAKQEVTARRKAREELLAKLGAIIEDAQLALPLEAAPEAEEEL